MNDPITNPGSGSPEPTSIPTPGNANVEKFEAVDGVPARVGEIIESRIGINSSEGELANAPLFIQDRIKFLKTLPTETAEKVTFLTGKIRGYYHTEDDIWLCKIDDITVLATDLNPQKLPESFNAYADVFKAKVNLAGQRDDNGHEICYFSLQGVLDVCGFNNGEYGRISFEEWEKMASSLDGWNNLVNILGLGAYASTSSLGAHIPSEAEGMGRCIDYWCDDGCKNLVIAIDDNYSRITPDSVLKGSHIGLAGEMMPFRMKKAR